MEKSKQIILTIIIVIVFIAIFAVITGAREDAGNSSPGVMGVLLFVGLIAGLRAIWRKDKE